MKIKALAVAVLMAAGSANAAINPGYAGNDGELFLTVFSPTLQASYNLDLGITANSFHMANSFAGINLAADADFATFVGQTDLRYTVTGSNYDMNDWYSIGLLTTTQNDGAHLTSTMRQFSDLELVMGRVGDMAGNINANASLTGQPNPGGALFNVNNSSVATVGNIGYYNTPTWNDTLGGSGFTTSASADSAIDFYFVGLDLDSGEDRNLSVLLGEWTLTSAGMLSYCAAGTCGGTNPVPVPAAAWLFASGLLGLVGVARRKAA